jgi:hypothetical protein
MADIVFRLAAITVAAVMLGFSVPRIIFALERERSMRK